MASGNGADPRRRRIILAGIGGVVLVIGLIVVPALIAARPGFFGRFPEFTEKYEPWSTSSHAAVGCEECHVPPQTAARVLYHAQSAERFYLSLIGRPPSPEQFAAPTTEACLECHNDMRSVSPEGDLQIPHRAHVTVLKMDCVECHDFLVHELSPEGKHTPQMEGCMRCHDGDTAKDTCTACHTEKAAPETHAADDWLIAHAEAAADPECDSCHKWTDDWCVDCHSRRPESHGEDWRKVHGARVAERRNCEACHVGSFCEPCHGEYPQTNFDPDLKLVQ